MTVERAQNPGGLIVVAGAGGFVGGHLVERLRAEGHTRIRAVDIKPFEDWYHRFAPSRQRAGAPR
jgi:GDP-D-mannose 3',5'-epimerase